MLSLLNSKIRVDSLSLVWAKSSDSRNCWHSKNTASSIHEVKAVTGSSTSWS
jgi:hypothetical protein